MCTKYYEAELNESFEVTQAGWMALRIQGNGQNEFEKELFAHTSPIYVIRGGRPIHIASDLTAMADYVRMVTERYRRFGVFADESQQREMLSNCESALAYYENALHSQL